MSALVDRFCEQHWTLNGITPDRRRDQAKQLRAFEDRIGKPLTEATSSDLSDFMRARMESGLHPNTVRKYRSLIMPFFHWAHREKLIDRLTLLDLRETPNPRGATGKGTPQPYSRRELTQFWADLDATYPRSDYYYNRWLAGRSKWIRVYEHAMRMQIEAIVALALYSGLRRNEIWGSEINDIHPDNEYVIIRSPAQKGGGARVAPRQVPLTPGASQRMLPWFEFLELLDPPHDRPWLSLWRQHHLTPMRAHRFACLLSTVHGNWRLHRFRHTCATTWLRAGMPVEKVQLLMGHARIDRTLQYARVLPDDVMRSALKHEGEFDRAANGEEAANAAA